MQRSSSPGLQKVVLMSYLPFAVIVVSSLLWLPGPMTPQETQPGAATQKRAESTQNNGLPTLEQLIKELKAKEKTAQSVVLEMTTRGVFPGGHEVKTSGTVRVSGTTHVHVTMAADFGEEMTGETETVKTPEGVWTRERDPMQGTVYTHIKPTLMKEIEEAMKVLGEGNDLPGVPNEINAAHGSAVLESLAQGFDLSVERKLKNEAQHIYVVKGNKKPGAPRAEDEELPEADAVEVLVRSSDLVLTSMRQFKDGKPILEVQITKFVTSDHELDKASFKIALPEGARFKDVMDHPPMEAQIRKLLADAKVADAKAKSGKKK